MSLRYKTIEDLMKQYSEAEVLLMVSRYLDDREARSDYHKKYNAKKNAMVKAINADPELKRRALAKLQETQEEGDKQVMESLKRELVLRANQ